MTDFPRLPLWPRQLTPEQQLQRAEQRFSAGMHQPASYGQGLQQIGNGIALGMARDRFNEGKPPHEQASSGIRRVAEALMGQQAPWQFPGAPQQGGGNAPAPKFDFSNLMGGLLGRRGPTGGGLY